MAKPRTVLEKVKEFWNSEVMDEEKWAQNSEIVILNLSTESPTIQAYNSSHQKLLRALGIFAGSIVLMRSYGDLMAI